MTACRLKPQRPSRRTQGGKNRIVFDNQLPRSVQVFSVNTDGNRQSYGSLAPNSRREQKNTYGGHVWLITDEQGQPLAVFEATDDPAVALIDGTRTEVRRPDLAVRPQRAAASGVFSGSWTASVRNNNVFIRSSENPASQIQLSQDGSRNDAYELLSWSPDSKTLVGWRVEPGDQGSLPGPVVAARRWPGRARNAALSAARRQVRRVRAQPLRRRQPQADQAQGRPDRLRWPRIRWDKDGRHFTYQKTDRGHQRFRLIEVDSHTGKSRNLIDEKSQTFIWTAHRENIRLATVNWLEKSRDHLRLRARRLAPPLPDRCQDRLGQEPDHQRIVRRARHRPDRRRRAPGLVPRQRQEPRPGPVLHPLLPRQFRWQRTGRADGGQRQPLRPVSLRTAAT